MGAILLALALVSAPLIVLIGCSSGGATKGRSGPAVAREHLQAADFAGAVPAASGQTTTNRPTRDEASREIAQANGERTEVPTRVVTPDEAREGEVVGVPRPTNPVRVFRSTDGTMLVDAKVGDLNGTPVLASSWLEPISGRLRAESTRMEIGTWRRFASGLIRERLAAQLKDELLYAEIQSTLRPEEQAGVRALVARAQRDQLRQTGGSVTLAERQLQEANDQTIDTFLRDRERQLLISEQYRREIDRRVQVSQRDIELFYRRNNEIFNQPPLATLQRIRVRASDEASIAEIKRRLASGEPFPEVALIEANNVDEIVTQREIKGPFEEFEFYGLAPLNEAARSLTPGRFVGPIEHGTSVSWLYLEQLENREVSLYDAQLAIENQLRNDQRREIEQRYIFRLIRRAGLAEFDRIVVQLTDIAQIWYFDGPSEPATSSAGQPSLRSSAAGAR